MQSIESIEFVFLVMAFSGWSAWCLYTGLYGLIKKRPLIRSDRGWWMIFILVNGANAAFGNDHAPFRFAYALVALSAIVQLINPAYHAVGVSGGSLYMAVDAAIAKLGLGVEVKAGIIHIPSEQLSIRVSRPFWGWGAIRALQRSGRQRLRQIAAQVAQSFDAGEVEVTYTMFVLNIVFGLALLGVAVAIAGEQLW